jgi:IclR family acetate operon transcriptional repressor
MRVETIKVLDRALAVLGLLALDDNGRSLAEVTAALRIPKSTARRFLLTMAQRNFVEFEAATERYRLGSALAGLGGAMQRNGNIVTLALPVLERLSRQTGETATLNVRFGDVRVCLAQVEGRERIRYVQEVGQSAPLYAGAQGKLLLAGLDEAELAAYLDRTPLAALAAGTITSAAALRKELERIRRAGYAVASGELTPDAAAVAAGVRDRLGKIVASIGIAGPIARMTPAKLVELAPVVTEAGGEVSLSLGHPLTLIRKAS